MKRVTVLVAAACAGVGSAAFGGGPQIPGTLNFQNMSGARIAQVQAELTSNEKEVDVGDFDNDGDLDVVIAVAYSDFGARRNKLYRNDGGVFNEVSGSPLIPGFALTDVSRNVFFRQFTHDEYLDIWVINDGNSSTPNAAVDKLYVAQVERGEVVLFQQINHGGNGSAGCGCCGALTRSSECSGVAADLDGDGTIDLWLGNYPNQSQDFLRFGNGNGTFGLLGAGPMVPTDCDYTVDIATADMNGDGTLDILISNWGSNKLYYNNRMGEGTQNGDFNYTGSVKILGNASSNENAMEPGDFNGDGDMDIYWSNVSGAGDRILQGTVNRANDTVSYLTLNILPTAVTGFITRKPTAADLNDDGRLDVFVGGHTTRPVILRNTSVNGVISFVDWTPGEAFPNGSQHRGWHAAVFDTNGDGDLDIFLGGWTNDHLFENVPPNQTTEGEAAGSLPALYNLDPVALVGSGGPGEEDEFIVPGIGSSSFISIVLNGADDYQLELLNSVGTPVSTSDRGALGVEEAMQVTTSAQTYTIRVTTLECANVYNLIGDCGVGIGDLLFLLANWDNPYGIGDLLDLLALWGPSDYVLEVLARSGP